jgi:uncharacterized lipoprotein YehR (DUF1307 family)
MKVRKIILVIVLVLLVVALSGCGDDWEGPVVSTGSPAQLNDYAQDAGGTVKAEAQRHANDLSATYNDKMAPAIRQAVYTGLLGYDPTAQGD